MGPVATINAAALPPFVPPQVAIHDPTVLAKARELRTALAAASSAREPGAAERPPRSSPAWRPSSTAARR
jgi:hypothetical protein